MCGALFKTDEDLKDHNINFHSTFSNFSSTSTDKQLSTNQAPNELPVVIKVERESPPPPGPERRLESTIPIAPRRSVGRGADRIGAEDFVRKDLMDDLMRIPEGGHR